MRLKLQYGNGVIALPRTVLTDYIPPDASYLYVLLSICAEPARLCETELLIPAVARECRLPERIVRNAVAFWLECGILERAEEGDMANTGAGEASAPPTESPTAQVTAPAQEAEPTPTAPAAVVATDKTPRAALPTYPAEEIARIIAETKELRPTLDECQRIAGKLFSEHECAQLTALYDAYGLDGAYLMTVFMYCKNHHGKTSVAYVVKTALGLYDEGIRSAEALDVHIAAKERLRDAEYKIRRLFGIGDRALTKPEKEYLENWINRWEMPFAVITRAYEITIKNIEKPRMSYVNKILSGWYENGIRSVEAVDAAEAAYAAERAGNANTGTAAPKDAAKPSDASYDLNAFLELAMKRSFEEGN